VQEGKLEPVSSRGVCQVITPTPAGKRAWTKWRLITDDRFADVLRLFERNLLSFIELLLHILLIIYCLKIQFLLGPFTSAQPDFSESLFFVFRVFLFTRGVLLPYN